MNGRRTKLILSVFIWGCALATLHNLLSAQSGSMRLAWEHQLADTTWSGEIVPLDHSAVVCLDRDILCMDQETGKQLWAHEFPSNINAVDKIGSDMIVGCDDGSITRIHDGRKVWSTATRGRIRRLVTIDEQTVAVISGRYALCIRTDSGRIAASVPLGAGWWHVSEIADSYNGRAVFLAGPRVIVLGTDGTELAIPVDVQIHTDYLGYVVGSSLYLLVSPGALASSRSVWIIDLKTGEVTKDYTLEGGARAANLASEHLLLYLAGSHDSRQAGPYDLRMLNLESGASASISGAPVTDLSWFGDCLYAQGPSSITRIDEDGRPMWTAACNGDSELGDSDTDHLCMVTRTRDAEETALSVLDNRTGQLIMEEVLPADQGYYALTLDRGMVFLLSGDKVTAYRIPSGN